jgi:methionyl-tRNA synthetase
MEAVVREPVYYVTTPIYYVNDVPHIGHAYTTVAADVIARYQRLRGRRVFFLTGTDEHGVKIEKTARERGITPRELVDEMVERFRGLWKTLNISNDDFIRTTEARHWRAVLAFYEAVKKSGDIYLGTYEDWYCIPCETFWTEGQLVNGACPECGRPAEKVREESYFFRLSAFQERLLEHLERHPEFIRPEAKRNEILSFIREGLKDLSISRTSFSWGIELPDDKRHVIYVWFDALINYLTAAGYPDDGERFAAVWPADVHLIGKDILRFHTVFWPAFLISAGLPLPRTVFAHGWWTVAGEKMSKSRGNVVDPAAVAGEYGVDPFRYFLLREVPFGLDGDFSREAMKNRLNSELANDLGNLFSRTIAMVKKYRGAVVPTPDREDPRCREFSALAAEVNDAVAAGMEELAFARVLGDIRRLAAAGNKFIDTETPWQLAKDEGRRTHLDQVLYCSLENLRLAALHLHPFMPEKTAAMAAQLGVPELFAAAGPEVYRWGGLPAGVTVQPGAALFPRIE